MSVLKQAVLAAVGYIAIMAVGMFTAWQVFGFDYFNPKIVYVLIFFEVVMAAYAILMARRIFGHWHCGFGPIDWRGIWWLVPNFLIIAALILGLFMTGTPANALLSLVIVVTMCLVGFSEELTFRGIALKGGLAGLSTGKAILLSAALFSALHAVNVLAMVPPAGALMQMGLTFLFGLGAACYALRVNSLAPLFVYHALWDMLQFLGGLWGAEFGLLIPIGVAVNALGAAALWWLELRKRKAAG